MLFFFLCCYNSHNIKNTSYFIKWRSWKKKSIEFRVAKKKRKESNRIKHEQLDQFSNMAAPMAQTVSVHTSNKNADKKTKTCKSRRETAVNIVNFIWILYYHNFISNLIVWPSEPPELLPDKMTRYLYVQMCKVKLNYSNIMENVTFSLRLKLTNCCQC